MHAITKASQRTAELFDAGAEPTGLAVDVGPFKRKDAEDRVLRM
jgi:hypothetical protein